MPYNTTAIPPRKEVTGQTQLPREFPSHLSHQATNHSHASRSHASEEGHCRRPRHHNLLQQCRLRHHPSHSKSTSLSHLDPATLAYQINGPANARHPQEMFIQYLTGEAQNMTKLERKPRRNIQYKDLGKLKTPPPSSLLLSWHSDSPLALAANAVAHQDNLEFLEDIIPKTTSYKDIKGKAAAARARLKGEKAGAAGEDDRPTDGFMPNGKKPKSIIMNGSGPSPPTNGFSRSRVLSSDAAEPNAQLEADMIQARSQGGNDNDVDMTG